MAQETGGSSDRRIIGGDPHVPLGPGAIYVAKALGADGRAFQGFVVNFGVRDADLHARRETTRVMPKRRRQRYSRSGSGVLARLGGKFLRP